MLSCNSDYEQKEVFLMWRQYQTYQTVVWLSSQISNSSDWVPEKSTFSESGMEYEWTYKNGWNQAGPVEKPGTRERCDSVRGLLSQEDIKVLGNLL